MNEDSHFDASDVLRRNERNRYGGMKFPFGPLETSPLDERFEKNFL